MIWGEPPFTYSHGLGIPHGFQISGDVNVSDAEIRDFARKANADEFICRMNQGGWIMEKPIDIKWE